MKYEITENKHFCVNFSYPPCLILIIFTPVCLADTASGYVLTTSNEIISP